MKHVMYDPLTKRSYDYEVRDEKEARLFEALQLAAKDECPPDKWEYLCMNNEAEEQDCEACLLRYATAKFGNYRK